MLKSEEKLTTLLSFVFGSSTFELIRLSILLLSSGLSEIKSISLDHFNSVLSKHSFCTKTANNTTDSVFIYL